MNQRLYFLPQFTPLSREMRHIHGSARSSSKLALPVIFTRIGASCQADLQPADAPPGACFHQSTHCENALAALYAGVVYPLHPLAGVDSARPLLFSGNAISYIEQPSHTVHSESSQLFGDVSLLNGELALPMLGGPRQPLDRQI
jgi:hypothetical protein